MTTSASDPPTHVLARRALRTAATCALLTCVAFAAAWGPADALGRPDGSRVLDATDRLRRAEEELARTRAGFGAELALTTGLTYGADVEDAAEPAATLGLDTELSWTWDRVAVLSAQIDAARAAIALDAARRLEGKEALELLGDLVRADLAQEDADAELREAQAAVDAARREADPAAIAYANLDLREAELRAADAQADVTALETIAAEWGLPGASAFVPARFALPIVDPVATPGSRIRHLDAAEIAARAVRGRTFGVLRDLELTGRWESRTDRYQLDASIGLPGGRPSASLSAAYGPQQDDQWQVALTARIAIDERTARDLAAVDRAAERAEAELAAWVATVAREMAEALRLAKLAEDRLDIALERLRIRETEARDARVRGVDTARVDAAVRRDRDRTYLAWLRYVEEVDDYLTLVGAPWEIAARGSDEMP